jgi:hypothetical protein
METVGLANSETISGVIGHLLLLQSPMLALVLGVVGLPDLLAPLGLE